MNTNPIHASYLKVQSLLVTERDLDKCCEASRDISPLYRSLQAAGLTVEESAELTDRIRDLHYRLRELSDKVRTERIDAEVELTAQLRELGKA